MQLARTNIKALFCLIYQFYVTKCISTPSTSTKICLICGDFLPNLMYFELILCSFRFYSSILARQCEQIKNKIQPLRRIQKYPYDLTIYGMCECVCVVVTRRLRNCFCFCIFCFFGLFFLFLQATKCEPRSSSIIIRTDINHLAVKLIHCTNKDS